MSDRFYKNTLWTNHALERVKQRSITQEMVWRTVNEPENQRAGKQPHSREFRRKYGERTLSVVAQPAEGHQWRILSCWLNPPMEGTPDWKEYQRYHEFRRSYDRAGFWGKFWLLLKRQLGF